MLGLKLTHVSRRGQRKRIIQCCLFVKYTNLIETEFAEIIYTHPRWCKLSQIQLYQSITLWYKCDKETPSGKDDIRILLLMKVARRYWRVVCLIAPCGLESTRWRHQMETFSTLLTFCVGNSPVTGEFPAQRPVTRSFDVVFDLRLNKWFSKRWDTSDLKHNPTHYDVIVMYTPFLNLRARRRCCIRKYHGITNVLKYLLFTIIIYLYPQDVFTCIWSS